MMVGGAVTAGAATAAVEMVVEVMAVGTPVVGWMAEE